MTLTPLQLATAMFAELVLGGVMGMGLMILFAALAFAGQLVGIQMGFAIANVVDPISSRQVGVLAQVLNLFGLALFLALDGHLTVLRAIFDSFGCAARRRDTAWQGIIETLVAEGAQCFRWA